MSQKVVSWALILAMLLGLFSASVSAASQITLDKSTYAAGERVRATVSGATQEMVDSKAFAAIYEEGAAHKSWLNYSYVKKVGTNTLDFTAPSKKGTYEMRLYSMDGTYTDATMVAKTTFTVGTVQAPSSNIKLTPDKALYAAGERVRVTVSGVTEEMVDDEAFVTIHEEDAAHKSWLNYNYVKKVGTNTVDFAAPSKKGTYEIRFYSMNSFYSDATMLMKTTINVGTISTPTSNVKLAPEKTTFSGGEVMKITVSGVTEEMVDDEAFVAIYEEDAAHKSWQNYVYVKKAGTSTVELKAPSQKGIYELRFYSMNDYYSDATMLTKSLIGVEMTPPVTIEPPKPVDPSVTIDPKPPVTPGPKPPTVQYGSFTAQVVDSGVKLSWTPVSGALGYRVYRSTKQGVEGISITDFAMNTTDFVDVNVDANITYYYVLRVLLKEATVSGDRELLSMASNEVSVKTGVTILGGNASDSGGKTKNVVLMKLDDPNMSYNGIKQEIDPGRGTTPQLINGRTFMPIRAVIEAMGGKIGWEDASSKITLEAGGHSVIMWLNKKDLVVDGANKEMDVAPASVNGRTMVPVRFAAENVGCVVDWISSTNEIVVVFHGNGSVVSPQTQTPAGDPSKPVETRPPVSEPMKPPATESPVTTDPKLPTTKIDDPGPGSGDDSDPGSISGSYSSEGPEIKISYTAAELAKLQGDIEKLIQDAPTNGRVITWEELMSILAPYEKDPGSGNTDYSKSMSGQFLKEANEWKAINMLQIGDNWNRDTDNKGETLYILYPLAEKVGAVECRLNKEDAIYYYTYEWYKTATTGIMSKYPKKDVPLNPYPNYTDYDPNNVPDYKVTLYPEATVDGQECIVYSFEMEEAEGMQIYFWFSKTKGFVTLMETTSPSMPFVSAVYTYESKRIDVATRFFDASNQGVAVWNER